jgi:predicted O-methyltransferase YrrM
MTTREATSLLARTSDTPIVGGGRRSLSDWAALLAIGAVQWPWLLRSLYGGRLEAKHALLDRLGLPDDALPYLGSWKADVGLLNQVTDHILEAKPETVVEFGTGASTLVLARALQMAGGGTLISFEQHADFVEATRKWLAEHGLDADVRAVPLGPAPDGWPGLWYRHGPLPKRIDFILVDGPPWALHPLTRAGAASLFDRIPVGGVVMLDDGARPGERLVARRWRKRFPDFDFELVKAGSKGTLVGTRRR